MRTQIFAAALILLASVNAGATIVDRIAATVDREVITVSEVDQVVTLKIFARNSGEDEDAYRRRILDAMIAQSLRFRDVERFGAEDISKDVIESRLMQVRKRFASDAEFDAALLKTELTLDEVRTIIKRQLQVEAYIEERFSPLIFVSLDEIERYYNEQWSRQRRERGLNVPPLTEAQEEIRTLVRAARLGAEIDRWTTQLRDRANVDIYAWR
jgi:peptidyl-prolyl cis-trans isomerase SurA